jgi:hypothetical protein
MMGVVLLISSIPFFFIRSYPKTGLIKGMETG